MNVKFFVRSAVYGVPAIAASFFGRLRPFAVSGRVRGHWHGDVVGMGRLRTVFAYSDNSAENGTFPEKKIHQIQQNSMEFCQNRCIRRNETDFRVKMGRYFRFTHIGWMI